jgi:hypothetical protein
MKTILKILAFLRPIVASRRFGLFGLPCSCYYFFCFYFGKRKELAKYRCRKYEAIDSLSGLCSYIKELYRYEADHLKGLLEHDGSIYEFCVRWGDCDDVARLALRKLRDVGCARQHSSGLITMMRGSDFASGHAECWWTDNDQVYIFNYGSPISGSSIDDCVRQLAAKWYAPGSPESVIWTRYSAI